MEADTLLLAMCNLMRSAKTKELAAKAAQAAADAGVPELLSAPAKIEVPIASPPAPVKADVIQPKLQTPAPPKLSVARQKEAARTKMTPSKTVQKPTAANNAADSVMAQIAKLTSLHEQGVLTDDEFKAAQQRLLAAARG